jgi:DNA-binding MarR family transcriptional regulator
LRIVAASTETGDWGPSDADLSRLTRLLGHIAVTLLREGSTRELGDEGTELRRFLDGDIGRQLLVRRPVVFGEWSGLASLAVAAAERRDDSSTSAFVRSLKHAEPLLQLLAASEKPIARSELKAHLELTESQLSHLLSELERVRVLVRHRQPGSRVVQVEILPRGRACVAPAEIPGWVNPAVGAIRRAVERLANRERVAPEQLIAQFKQLGVPDGIAQSLTAALGILRPLRRIRAEEATYIGARTRATSRESSASLPRGYVIGG